MYIYIYIERERCVNMPCVYMEARLVRVSQDVSHFMRRPYVRSQARALASCLIVLHGYMFPTVKSICCYHYHIISITPHNNDSY